MLEHHANQAAGLLGLGSRNGPRMLAVVNHGDEQAELPLLWQLCLALVNFGYAVTVLDATTRESDANPGLLELLESAHWHDNTTRDTPAWLVLPAGNGMQSLCAPHSPRVRGLQQLGHLFPQESVVVLYCKVEWMIPLIAGTGIEPLLAVSQTRTSLITSYLALKRLLITGKLQPTIVNMIQAQPSTSPTLEQPTATSLSECAKRFLGQDVKALNIIEELNEEIQSEDIQRLALRLMENAIALSHMDAPIAASSNASMAHFDQVDHFAGSH
jgi:hypothetical protein